MSALRLYNTLTRTVETFTPLAPPEVKLYTCGPTVYDYPHIGNWRTFVFDDLLRRTLEYGGYTVTHVMNLTDVGHLTGDNIGDADTGEDRMEKAARREGKNIWDIALFYINDFKETSQWLNLLPPAKLVRATDHIPEQITLIQKLERNGFTYRTQLGVYFNTAKLPDYGKLGGQKLSDKRAATREELVEDPGKQSSFDFALWKFSPPAGGPEGKRQMEWDSPWGKGFPGWHIECSAMAMKYLGETLDIHTGGIDHVAIHHTNEIAQSEAATGKPFSRFWMHGEFLTVDGGRMGKSLGNAYTLHDLKAKGVDPLALRYLYLTAHYRSTQNFTWDALQGAQNSLTELRGKVAQWKADAGDAQAVPGATATEFRKRFAEALHQDLNIPQALALAWEAAKSDALAHADKYSLLMDFDRVLGLGLGEALPESWLTVNEVPQEIQELIQKREAARKEKSFSQADDIRREILSLGYALEDTPQGLKIKRIS